MVPVCPLGGTMAVPGSAMGERAWNLLPSNWLWWQGHTTTSQRHRASFDPQETRDWKDPVRKFTSASFPSGLFQGAGVPHGLCRRPEGGQKQGCFLKVLRPAHQCMTLYLLSCSPHSLICPSFLLSWNCSSQLAIGTLLYTKALLSRTPGRRQ